MATMSPPNAAVPRWKKKVLKTEAITVGDPTMNLFCAKYHVETDMAITICGASSQGTNDGQGMYSFRNRRTVARWTATHQPSNQHPALQPGSGLGGA